MINNLYKISEWAFQWKMLFNPDPNKQALEVCFSHKRRKNNYPAATFNNKEVKLATSQKHLGLILDSKLDFQEHIDNKINKCNRIIGIMKRLLSVISRKNLLTIYKSFVRPHLDYADIIYDNPFNDSFKEKIERVQYNASLVTTGTIKGTSQEHLYKELGLESLSARRWSHRLIFFYKIIKRISPSYLMSYLMSNNNDSYNTRSCSHNKIKSLKTRTQAFRLCFLPLLYYRME